MAKMPKWPKGLKARLAKARKKAEREKKIADRKKEIAAARTELNRLQSGKKSKR
jgi:hypothetical protein